MDQFLDPETDANRQFLDPDTDKNYKFLDKNLLDPETDIMRERTYIHLSLKEFTYICRGRKMSKTLLRCS